MGLGCWLTLLRNMHILASSTRLDYWRRGRDGNQGARANHGPDILPVREARASTTTTYYSLLLMNHDYELISMI